MTRDYVQAAAAVIKAGQAPEAVLARLQAVLAARGHSRLLPRIMRTLVRDMSRQEIVGAPTLTIARPSDATTAVVASLEQALAVDHATVRIVVDESVIGGAQLRAGATTIDATYKTALVTLYHSLTK